MSGNPHIVYPLGPQWLWVIVKHGPVMRGADNYPLKSSVESKLRLSPHADIGFFQSAQFALVQNGRLLNSGIEWG